MVLQLCETSTGVLYDMNMVGDFCKDEGCFLFVDAVSGFLADKISMKNMHINAAITGSQKALALPPSMSFTVMDKEAQARCMTNKVKSMYFNYADYLVGVLRAPSLTCFLKTMKAVTNANTYISPYHRNKLRNFMFGKICGLNHEG